MNPYIPLHFLAAFSYLFLGIYSHLQDRKAKANRVFLVLCLVTALWAFCVGCILLSPTQREADFWYFLSAPGWCFAPGLVLLFSVDLIQRDRPSRWFFVLPFCLPGIALLGRSILDFAMHGAIVSFNFPLPWDLVNTAYYVIGLASSMVLIWRWGLQTKIKRERRQAKILGTTLAAGFGLTLLNETILPNLGVLFIPRIPDVLMLVWAFGIFYAITRYRLMQLTPAFAASWITSQVTDLLFLINPDNCILQINAKASKTLGYGEEELNHQSFDRLVPSEQQGLLLQQNVDKPAEISRAILQSKAGTSIPVHVHITPFLDPAGDRLGTLIIAQDLRPLIDLEIQIAEREQAEEILKQSELQYHSTIDALADIISVCDRQGRILLVNETLLRWNRRWNLPLDVLGKSLYELFSFLSETLPQEYEQVFKTGESLNTEKRIDFAGEEVFVETRKIPILEEGEVKKVVTIIRDVTERKQSEDALRESKERLELALIGGNLGFYDFDLQTGEGYTDERYLDMLGYAPGEIDLGCRANWEQQVHPDDLRFANHLVRSAIQGEMPVYDEEYRMRHKSGEWVWVRDHSRITACSDDGRPLRVTGIHENITERKRSEVALRESEERFRRIFQSATDCIFIKNRSLQYIEVNPAMEKLLNSSSGLLVGKNNEDLFGPEAVKLAKADRRALAGETVESEDVLWVQGIPYTFLTVKMPLRDNAGSIVGVIGIARDISERARAERELNRNREQLEEMVRDRTIALEQTNLALKTLTQKLVETQETERRDIARELHDDIGQELTGLKLLLERSYRNAPPELETSLKDVDGLVGGILTKIRDMALNLRPSMLDDLGLLPALLYQFEHFTTLTQIETRFQHIGLEIRFSPEIETAAYRIIQEALTNVARHARTSEVWITVENQGGDLWLTVTDQGIGFDPEQGLAGGNSTGLKGIRERISAIGGSFVLKSIPGSGSMLKVRLPLREKGLDPPT
jgi:PAS domain S-box-containing protein